MAQVPEAESANSDLDVAERAEYIISDLLGQRRSRFKFGKSDRVYSFVNDLEKLIRNRHQNQKGRLHALSTGPVSPKRIDFGRGKLLAAPDLRLLGNVMLGSIEDLVHYIKLLGDLDRQRIAPKSDRRRIYRY